MGAATATLARVALALVPIIVLLDLLGFLGRFRARVCTTRSCRLLVPGSGSGPRSALEGAGCGGWPRVGESPLGAGSSGDTRSRISLLCVVPLGRVLVSHFGRGASLMGRFLFSGDK